MISGISTILLMVISVGGLSLGYTQKVETAQENSKQDLSLITQALLDTQLRLQSLEAEFAQFQEVTGDKFSETADSLSSATNKLQQQLAASSEPKLEKVVQSWQPRVARISCIVSDGNTLVQQVGAGTLFSRQGKNLFITNNHVVDGASACSYELPALGLSGVLDLESLDKHSSGQDYVEIQAQTGLDKLATSVTKSGYMCSDKAMTGDPVAVMGFPQTGAQTASTLTEGVISGYEEGLYLTSAKVERGNSGGAAIDVNNNCYLGIPTFVTVGSFESLARILDVPTLLKSE
jgi:S1-C subfamily serine protease